LANIWQIDSDFVRVRARPFTTNQIANSNESPS
jgi:hypothetical protein